jgi:ABC-type multidrug transport system permease subunit
MCVYVCVCALAFAVLQERASGMYRLSAFYFARMASDLPMDLTIPTIFILIIYFMSGLRLTAAAFFENYFAVILVGGPCCPLSRV